jgi:hypothetical protein
MIALQRDIVSTAAEAPVPEALTHVEPLLLRMRAFDILVRGEPEAAWSEAALRRTPATA